MATMDNSIADAYFKGYIGRDEAIARSSNPAKMEKVLSILSRPWTIAAELMYMRALSHAKRCAGRLVRIIST